VICDSERRIDWVNAAFEQMSGYGLDEVKGKCPESFIFGPSGSLPEWRDMRLALAEGRGFQGELLCNRKNGQQFWTELQVQPMRNNAGEITHYVSMGSDITERKIRQEEEAHNDRLKMIGRLASGVAHEINNPLTILMGAMNIFRDRHPSPEEFSRLRDRVLRAGDRIDSIVKGLRTFSRSDAQALVELDFCSFLKDTVAFFEPLLNKKKAKINLDLGKSPLMVHGDSSRLQQVMANLITNALDAMEGRAAPELIIRAFQEGHEAVLVVSDNGSGIEKENLNRVFDPFFTSKPPGQGTGLGLAICYGIVRDHSGQISVESEVGAGTSIFVRLPLAGLASDSSTALGASSAPSGLESGLQS
jgi:PAS domain S-box-containing protein